MAGETEVEFREIEGRLFRTFICGNGGSWTVDRLNEELPPTFMLDAEWPAVKALDVVASELLSEAGFDAFVEEVCRPCYAPRMGAPSLPPGRYFRMHMIGYFEGLDSERGIAWRCADSYSLRDFLRLSNVEKVPDHSWLSRTRSRLPHETHEKVFGWVLKLVAERGLVKGERIGVDGSTMEANAALRTIIRRDNGESYRAMLARMAQESGIETPSAEDLARFDRKRKGKTLSNADWKSPTDPDARIAKMKD